MNTQPPKNPPNNPTGASATSDAADALRRDPNAPAPPQAPQKTTADEPPNPRSPAYQSSDHPELPVTPVDPATGKPVRQAGLPPGDRGSFQPLNPPPEQVAEGTSRSAGKGATPRQGDRVLYCLSAGHERGAEVTRVHTRSFDDPDFKGPKVNLIVALDGRADDALVDAIERSNNNLGERPLTHVHRTAVLPSSSGTPEAGTWRHLPQG